MSKRVTKLMASSIAAAAVCAVYGDDLLELCEKASVIANAKLDEYIGPELMAQLKALPEEWVATHDTVRINAQGYAARVRYSVLGNVQEAFSNFDRREDFNAAIIQLLNLTRERYPDEVCFRPQPADYRHFALRFDLTDEAEIETAQKLMTDLEELKGEMRKFFFDTRATALSFTTVKNLLSGWPDVTSLVDEELLTGKPKPAATSSVPALRVEEIMGRINKKLAA